jgi:ABC-2 type transport system permease protein
MSIVVRCNPLTYAVHLARDSVFDTLSASPAAKAQLNPSLTWFGWAVPDALSVLMVLAIGLALLSVAFAQFSRVE